MATRQFNPFPKKGGLKREPPQNLHPHVPQRESEPEEYINEYDCMAENEEAKANQGPDKAEVTAKEIPPKKRNEGK